jgi:hypothetical protein
MIIAVDPGKVSGIATWDGERLESWQEPTWFAIDRIWGLLEDNAPPTLSAPPQMIEAIVCESYVITASTLRKTRGENWSLESIGALRWMARRHSVEFVLQTPADAKRFADDVKLKAAAGWYRPTPGGHANDAARHLMTYLARNDVELFTRVIAG